MIKCLIIGVTLAVIYTVYAEYSEKKKQKADAGKAPESVTEDA